MELMNNIDDAVEKIIQKIGKKIVMGAPLGAGKPNYLINAVYARAKKDSSIDLTICTALTLERPKPKSDLEKKFLGPFEQRVFGDYPDLTYELDRSKKQIPPNIRVIEFYFPPGKFLRSPSSQRNYISSNYTHVCRDMMDRGVNLIVQMVAKDGDQISLSCNADVTTDMMKQMKELNHPVMTVLQVNQNLPFMYGEALQPANDFDIIVDNPNQYYKVFGPPKMSIPNVDFMIGLYTARLVKDDGELQVGIGSLGDAVIYSLILRQKSNQVFKELLSKLKCDEKFGDICSRLGDQAPFEKGLFGATEMMVDVFKELYENDILKKKVYDHIPLQRLINQGVLNPENFSADILDLLCTHKIISKDLSSEDLSFLKYWGIVRDEVNLDSLQDAFKNKNFDIDFQNQFLGTQLKHGHLTHAGFFLGPQSFYDWLKGLDQKTRKLFSMKSVLKINQLYGHEQIDRLHRKNARFINTCMMTTLAGAHVSDGLADGRVVSGVGGQYNFVAMAQELPDAHSIITMRSTRTSKGKVYSNILFNYGHITIPRHLRDVLVTEYGIAFLRGKTDEEIIKALLNICDSRFQEELLNQAKKAGKIHPLYKIPKEFKNNLPHVYEKIMEDYKQQGFFKPFPFGTDLTELEIKIGGQLKKAKKQMDSGLLDKIKFLIKVLKTDASGLDQDLIERMQLKSTGFKNKFYKKLLSVKLN